MPKSDYESVSSLTELTVPSIPASWGHVFRWTLQKEPKYSNPKNFFIYLTLEVEEEYTRGFWKKRTVRRWTTVSRDILARLDQWNINIASKSILAAARNTYGISENVVYPERTH